MKEKRTELEKKKSVEMVPYYKDEISFVDIAKLIIRRRKVFLVTFGIVFALTIPFTIKTYMNKPVVILSIYNVAMEGEPIEKNTSLLQVIEFYYKDVVVSELIDYDYAKMELKASNPTGTNYIFLESEILEHDLENGKKFHLKILEKVKEGQDGILAKDLQSLDGRINDTKLELELIKKEKQELKSSRNEKAPEAMVGFTTQIILLESKIKELEKQKFYFKHGEIIQVGEKKSKRIGTGASKVLMAGTVSGIILGIFAILCYEFFIAVRNSLLEEQERNT